MARYDYESTLEYAQQKVDEARASREKTIKDQEKFSKRLLMFDTAVKGANYLINQRADELESSFGPAKTKYKSYIQNAEETTKYWNEVQKKGGLDYLQKQIYDSYLESAKEIKPFEEVRNISGWINEQATEKANELYSALEQKAKQAKDVPTMEDFINDYENFAEIQAPRTLFGAAKNGIKRILGRENSETLEYKKNIAKEKLFNTDVIKEIDEFAKFADTYDKLGYDTPGLIKKMNEQFVEGKAGEIGKKVRSSKIEKIDLGNEIKVVSFIEYEDGSTAKPKIILEEKKNDLSSTIQTASLISMVNNIKKDKVDGFIKILTGEGNTPLKSNTGAAYIWAIENDAIKINLDDAKKANDFVDNIYQDVLQSKFTKEGMPMFEQDINTKDYRVRPEYLAQAKEEGWDAETFKQTQFDKLGINYKINKELESTGEKGIKGLTGFNEITDTTLKELASNPNSLISKFTLETIGNQTSGIIDLTKGKAVDLEEFLPDSELKGVGIIKYDIDNNKYYIKETKGTDGSNFKSINLTGETEEIDNTLTPFEKMLNDKKQKGIKAKEFTSLINKIKPSPFLTRYFKETEAQADVKKEFENIYKDLVKKYPQAFRTSAAWALENPKEAEEITTIINDFLKTK
jgi:hypothetical protein